MTRAMSAAAKSQVRVLFDRLHLDDAEIVDVALDVAIRQMGKAGLDRRGLHARLDDALAAAAVEGTNDAEIEVAE